MPLVVEVQPVGVGVAGQIEPVAGHLLAIMLRAEIAIDHLLVSVRRLVHKERIDFRNGRRQTRQRERHAANQRRPIRFRRHRHTFTFEPSKDERVDRVPVTSFGSTTLHRRLERPVLLIFRPLRDPFFEQLLLLGLERLVRIRRRHHLVGVGAEETLDDLALGRLARHDRRRLALGGLDRLITQVEPKAALSRRGAVAAEAIVGEDGPYVAVVFDIGVGVGGRQAEKDRCEKERARGRHHDSIHGKKSASVGRPLL